MILKQKTYNEPIQYCYFAQCWVQSNNVEIMYMIIFISDKINLPQTVGSVKIFQFSNKSQLNLSVWVWS